MSPDLKKLRELAYAAQKNVSGPWSLSRHEWQPEGYIGLDASKHSEFALVVYTMEEDREMGTNSNRIKNW